jgi:hypothetical protein
VGSYRSGALVCFVTALLPIGLSPPLPCRRRVVLLGGRVGGKSGGCAGVAGEARYKVIQTRIQQVKVPSEELRTA